MMWVRVGVWGRVSPDWARRLWPRCSNYLINFRKTLRVSPQLTAPFPKLSSLSLRETRAIRETGAIEIRSLRSQGQISEQP